MFSYVRIILSDTHTEIYERGKVYYEKGKVTKISSTSASYTAHVRGTETYTVTLGFAKIGSPKYSCSCPYMTQQTRKKNPCKHVIAAALEWDTSRDVPIPSAHDVADLSIPSPAISYTDIQKAYDDPLHTDLEVIRIASGELGFSPRPHARLPDKPRGVSASLSSAKNVSVALSEIESWTDRRGYDMYFCAGEMVAALCETIRAVQHSITSLNISEKIKILRELIAFNKKLILKYIDDSDGLHIFTEAHLVELIDYVRLNTQGLTAQQHTQFRQLKTSLTDY